MILKEGLHKVIIDKITESSLEENPEWFRVVFKNEVGFFEETFFTSLSEQPKILTLFNACDLESLPLSILNTDDLLNKILAIEIVTETNNNNTFKINNYISLYEFEYKEVLEVEYNSFNNQSNSDDVYQIDQAEKDTFDALTDGLDMDYNEWLEDGNDLSDLNDLLGHS